MFWHHFVNVAHLHVGLELSALIPLQDQVHVVDVGLLGLHNLVDLEELRPVSPKSTTSTSIAIVWGVRLGGDEQTSTRGGDYKV